MGPHPFNKRQSLNTSWPNSDPKGVEPPSTRDMIAIHIAAAMYLKDKGSSTSPGASYGRDAYRFADQMLEAREALEAEANSQHQA